MKTPFTPFPILETERLTLKQLNFRHEKALFEYQSNKANFPYVNMPVYTSIEDAKNYVIKMHSGVDQKQWIVWAICLQSTDEIIGTISIWNLNNEEEKAELGYGIFPKYRRKGYMKEALLKVLEYGFETMELKTIEAYTSPINESSVKFLEANDFTFVKTEPDSYSDNQLMSQFKRCGQ